MYLLFFFAVVANCFVTECCILIPFTRIIVTFTIPFCVPVAKQQIVNMFYFWILRTLVMPSGKSQYLLPSCENVYDFRPTWNRQVCSRMILLVFYISNRLFSVYIYSSKSLKNFQLGKPEFSPTVTRALFMLFINKYTYAMTDCFS